MKKIKVYTLPTPEDPDQLKVFATVETWTACKLEDFFWIDLEPFFTWESLEAKEKNINISILALSVYVHFDELFQEKHNISFIREPAGNPYYTNNQQDFQTLFKKCLYEMEQDQKELEATTRG